MAVAPLESGAESTNTIGPRATWQTYGLWVVLALGAVLMIGPFYWTLVTSFKSPAELRLFPPTWWPQDPTLEHWRSLNNLQFGSFVNFFRNSLIVVVTQTAFVLLFCAMAGYVFAKFQFRGRNVLFWAMVLGTMMLPEDLLIIPQFDLIVQMGLTNSLFALIIRDLFYPLGIFIMRQAMYNIPNELLDAARVDGAGEFISFFRIALPLTTAALSALGIFYFIVMWDSFLWPLVVIDQPALYTIPLGLAQFRGRFGTAIGPVAAGAMVAVLPVIVVYLFAQRQFIEGITQSGLKG
jgi:multiple sugar transport system permease protein